MEESVMGPVPIPLGQYPSLSSHSSPLNARSQFSPLHAAPLPIASGKPAPGASLPQARSSPGIRPQQRAVDVNRG